MTNLGPSLKIDGDVISHEDVTLHGTVKGTITMQEGVLVVARTGTAVANVQGSSITVHGNASGDFLASDRIELTNTANVNGTIAAPSLILREGAVFNGEIDVWVRSGRAESPRPRLTVVAEILGVTKAELA